ncbi:MAG: ATP synthase F1 subunit epsilon [Opitutales bacterium]|nr:ATP synthase F1 subunit epsilon [Opitutales bacterium]
MPLYLEIVTPEGIVWKSGDVDAVSLPTRSGEVQILPGHIPLVAMLEAGDLKVFSGGKAQDLAVDKGYVRCMGDVVSVLTEAAIEVEKIDYESVEAAKRRAMEALEKAKSAREIDGDEIERLEAVIRFSIVQQLAKRR